MSETPPELDAITTHVLNYRPLEKGQAVSTAKEKIKKADKAKKKRESSI